MPDKLEPISDAFGSLLDSLGIPKDNWQQHLVNFKTKKRMSTKTKSQLNREYYETAGRLESIRAVAQRIQAKAVVVWQPLAYVMFIRHSHCKNCNSDSSCMDCPSLYLMETDKPGSPTRRYTPVPHIEYPNLPRYFKDTSVVTDFCMDCFQVVELPVSEPQVEISPSSETENSSCPPTD